MKSGDLFITVDTKEIYRLPYFSFQNILADVKPNTTGLILMSCYEEKSLIESWIKVLLSDGIVGWCTTSNVQVINETR